LEAKFSAARAWKFVSTAWRVLASSALLLVSAELLCRAVATREPKSRGSADDGVPYTLHPFLQMTNPAAADVDAGPDFAGFRIDPLDGPRDPQRLRVLFLGGSTMANSFPHHVREELEAALGPLTIYNLAYDWYTALHSLYQLWTYVDVIDPDLVVVLHNVNDLCRGFTPPAFSLPQYREDYSHHAGALAMFWNQTHAEFDGRPTFNAPTRNAIARRTTVRPKRGLAELLRQESALYSVLVPSKGARAERLAQWRESFHAEADVLRAPLGDDELLRALPAFERHMTNLRDSCRAKNAPVLFLTMPWCAQSANLQFLATNGLLTNDGKRFMTREDFAKGMRCFNDAVRRLADEDSSTVFDLAPELRECALFVDEVHLNERGLVREARLVSEHIVASDLLSPR